MGRPLNKKYFGNKNSPYTDFQGITTPDSGTGAEGVASIAIGGTNTGKTAIPAIVIGNPNLPGGVLAVARAHMEVESVVNFLAGDGYAVDEVLTLVEPGDAAVVRATLKVTAIVDPDVNGLGPIDTVTIVTAGDYTTLPADVTRYSVTSSGAGVGADFNLTFKVKSVEVTTTGSGYTSAPAITTQGGTTFTATLTSTAPEAILATAFVTGGSAKAADIIKQSNDRRYKVETADGVMVCQLKTTAAPNAAGEMTIKATDGAGGTYYVAKLTSRKAVLVRDTGTEFATGQAAKWSLTAASTANGVVKLDTI